MHLIALQTLQMSFHAGSDDAPLSKFEDAAKSRGDAVGAACEFFTYKQKHGFCATRADYADAECTQEVADVIDRSTSFLAKNLK